MAIPEIVPYPLPADSDLPDNVVSWQPDPDRAVLLVHDMQRYFVNFFPAGPLRTGLVENIRRLRRVATAHGLPVVYTAQPGAMTREQRGLLHDFWGPGMGDDPAGRQIVEELAPDGSDTVLTKWRYSAFHRSELAELIRDAGRDQLIVCGIYAHIGCLMTACDAYTLDIQPFLVADAVADFTVQEHRLALDYAARRCAAVVSTGQVVDALTAAHYAPAS